MPNELESNMEHMNNRIDELILIESQRELQISEQAELDDWVSISDENMSYYLQTKSIILDSSFNTNFEIPELSFDYSRLPEQKTTIIPFIIKIAAALILTLGATYLFINSNTEVTHFTAQSTIEKVTLPDGSVVTMNNQSELLIEDNFNSEHRNVTLNGEAYFEIQRSSTPFIINANGTLIEVLGTKFNVISSELKTEVTVASGKVKVSKGDHSITLVKGEAAVSENEIVLLLNTNTPQYQIASWKSDKWTFRDERLGDVFTFLENTYHVDLKVEDPDINELRIVSSMSKSSIETILQNIAELYDLKVVSSGTTYRIQRKM